MSDRIVEVLWEDSASETDWQEERQILALKPGLIRTVGYVHEDSDAMIRLMSDVPVIEDGGTKGRILAIPRSAIRKVTELKRGRRN